MTTVTRSINLNGRAILQFNAIYLLGAAAAGLIMDISGIFFSTGPQSGLVSERREDGLKPPVVWRGIAARHFIAPP
jgi:hypothetical protein